MGKIRVYLGLGGDQGAVVPRLQQALHLLSEEPFVVDLACSHFYRTSPVGMESAFPVSSWFVNAVCAFSTSASAMEIFAVTQRIERLLGKVSKPKNASRPIDIDLLFYGDQIVCEGELEIPHPRWKERLFVLVPLKELTPEIVIRGEGGQERYGVDEWIRSLLDEGSQNLFKIDD